MINLERQHSYIDLVGGPTDNTAEVTQDDLQRNRPSILEAVGQGNAQVYYLFTSKDTLAYIFS
jgi:hypothetical protein